MIVTIQLKSVRSVFCEYLNFKFSLVEKYSYCFSLSKHILILLFLRLFLAFFLLFCNVSQTLKWPSKKGFLEWAHLLTCGTTMETGWTELATFGLELATFGPNLDTFRKWCIGWILSICWSWWDWGTYFSLCWCTCWSFMFWRRSTKDENYYWNTEWLFLYL